ncbi:serine hydrolase domain-containing protein [Marinicauda salina]|nr:serine hydrolase domain-containing protein [Marinicauda salina]
MIRIAAITATAFWAVSGAAAQAQADLSACSVESAVAEIDDVMTGFGADGHAGAVIVEVEGEVILSRGYGLAERDGETPFTPDTIAQIGSLTKQFTATAVLLLADRGAIALDDPIGAHIDSADGPVADVTIHQLLTHSGGLPEYCGRDFDAASRASLFGDCLSGPLLFEPGTDTAYSNAGYSVLAALVETVSGEDLETFLETEILEPNGLADTGYHFDESDRARLAHGYLDGRDQGVISDRIAALGDTWWNLKGNGGMQASTEDMHRWRRVLQGRGALPDPVVERLRTPAAPFEDGVAEGYGWFFRDDGTGEARQMSHAGSDGVFFSYYWDRLVDGVFLYFVSSTGEEAGVDALRAARGVLREAFVEDCPAPD